MNNTLVGALIGLGLFLVFERKRMAEWRAKYLAHRQRRAQKDHASTLARALAEAGFFSDLTDAEALELRTEIETVGYGGVFSHPWRDLDADDEELAEGQVGLFLQSWAPSLARLGVAPLVGVDRFEEGGAHVLDLDNGETITLVSLQETERDGRDGQERFGWGAVAARVLERINRELAAADKADRFYSVYGGNDGRVLILSPDMLVAITNTPGLRRDELPYIRTAEWPYFGMSVDCPPI
jgi:hypothetical protein